MANHKMLRYGIRILVRLLQVMCVDSTRPQNGLMLSIMEGNKH